MKSLDDRSEEAPEQTTEQADGAPQPQWMSTLAATCQEYMKNLPEVWLLFKHREEPRVVSKLALCRIWLYLQYRPKARL